MQTYCIGMAMSAAAMLLAGGAAGKRYVLPNSKVMIHQGSGGFRGTPADIQIAAKEILTLTRRYAEMIARACGSRRRAGAARHRPRPLPRAGRGGRVRARRHGARRRGRSRRPGNVRGMAAAWVDESEHGFGWIAPEPAFMRRCSHALAVDGRVWLIDPVWDEEALERAAALGEPAGVVQLLDRHGRDCARVAEQFGVPLHVVPAAAPAGAPFEVIPLLREPLLAARSRSGSRRSARSSPRTRSARRSTTAARRSGSPSRRCCA